MGTVPRWFSDPWSDGFDGERGQEEAARTDSTQDSSEPWTDAEVCAIVKDLKDAGWRCPPHPS